MEDEAEERIEDHDAEGLREWQWTESVVPASMYCSYVSLQCCCRIVVQVHNAVGLLCTLGKSNPSRTQTTRCIQ